MTRTIRVDDEVYAALQDQARPFEDTPNSALRRVLGIDEAEKSQLSTVSKTPTETDALQSTQAINSQGKSTMSNPKFDELDRKRTIKAVEHYFNIKLSKVGSRRKFFVDQYGTHCWIFGGYGDWHGFPEKMINDEVKRDHKGMLVFAKRTRTKIKIYSGPLKKLIQGKDKLSRNQQGDLQFILTWRGDEVYVKENPEVSLKSLTDIEYSVEEKEKDRTFKEAKKSLAALSNHERKLLMKEYELNQF